MKVDLGAGNDEVTFVIQGFDCFNAYELIKTKVTVTLKNAAGASSKASTTVTLKR